MRCATILLKGHILIHSLLLLLKTSLVFLSTVNKERIFNDKIVSEQFKKDKKIKKHPF